MQKRGQEIKLTLRYGEGGSQYTKPNAQVGMKVGVYTLGGGGQAVVRLGQALERNAG
jgi:hypothetical protein